MGRLAGNLRCAHSEYRWGSRQEDWEQPYLERLAAIATSKGGTVPEVGYGMGIGAAALQACNVDSPQHSRKFFLRTSGELILLPDRQDLAEVP